MKKFMVGVGLAMALAGTAAAQQPGQAPGSKQDSKQEHGMRGERRGRGGPDGLLLKGIELTEGQRTQIAQLRKTQRDAMQSKREGGKPESGKKEARAQERAQARAQHIAAVRNVLTAEQRVQFDKNVAELKAREASGPRKHGKARGRA